MRESVPSTSNLSALFCGDTEDEFDDELELELIEDELIEEELSSEGAEEPLRERVIEALKAMVG